MPRLKRADGAPPILGLAGAQGTGKSTLADYLVVASEALFGWRSTVVSIDDFYLTRTERQALATDVHPLLETRGVPGTHDVSRLNDALAALRRLKDGERLQLPRFDKSMDDRVPETDFAVVYGPLDFIVFEGWCVGSQAQSREALRSPINDLERLGDPDGTWRRYVNDCLRADYEPLFDGLDALAYLAAPSFDAVIRWRVEQEKKLRRRVGDRGQRVLSNSGVARFASHFERITRHDLETLPNHADAVIELNDAHAAVGCRFSGRLGDDA